MYILYTPRIFAATSNSDIVCKTEKDRTRVHDRTAGDFKSDNVYTNIIWQNFFNIALFF